MDSIIKNFSIGFLIRSIFAGAFFLISYLSAKNGLHSLPDAVIQHDVVKITALSVFVGVVAYGLHRSFLYPIVEFLLDSPCAKSRRSKGCTLIRKTTVDSLLARWSRCEKDKKDETIAKHISVWADYAHLQYVSAECVIFGAIVSRCIGTTESHFSWPMTRLILAFLAAAFVSDWRLHSVEDEVVAREEAAAKKTPLPASCWW